MKANIVGSSVVAHGLCDWTEFFPVLNDPNQVNRIKTIEAQLKKVIDQLAKITEAAKKDNSQNVLFALNEEFEIPDFVPRNLTQAELGQSRR